MAVWSFVASQDYAVLSDEDLLGIAAGAVLFQRGSAKVAKAMFNRALITEKRAADYYAETGEGE